jgi:4-hydroxy-tetrahydrodipicolinate synthase
MKDLFIETNPIPIKTAMAYKGLVKGEYRLPLCPISEANGKILRETMQRVGLI